jgi:aminomethyltransferase
MTLRKTALHAKHLEHGAKMGGFAGYDMPLFYGEGVLKEHLWTRAHAGLFDVSHMGQVIVEGPGAAEFFERLTPSDFKNKKHGRAQYTVLTNEEGGIIDDLIVTRLSDNKFFAVINAGCKDKDVAWMRKHLPAGLNFDFQDDRGLIAIQGPSAEKVLREVLQVDLSGLPYMHLREQDDMFISRLGYTGEDGFEISVAANKAPVLWSKLAAHAEVKPIGLAARDSLRLEMGYALYGHDIDDTTSPLEAGLPWIMGKANNGFTGVARVLKEKEQGPKRKRVGLKLLDKGVAREGAEIHDSHGKKIGTLTSGGFSPSLQQSIGQGYVESAHAAIGEKLFVHVRGRNIAAEVVALPFIPAKTKSMKKEAA